jgi:hypothetical protein
MAAEQPQRSCTRILLLDGIDTIDASDADLTFLGHGYYAEARPVLTDMHAALLAIPSLTPVW